MRQTKGTRAGRGRVRTRGVTLAAALLATGCVASGGVQPEPMAPPPAAEVPAADPEPPDLTLEERWNAPFAVVSSGQAAAGRSDGGVDSVGERRRAPAPESPPSSPRSAPRTDPERLAEPAGEAAPAVLVEEADSLRTHRVQWGETWFGIARRYGVSRASLSVANPAVDPERLRAGEVLLIPASAGVGGVRTHTVVSGDSLWGIARRYGVEMEAIREANALDGDRVRIGQTLVIPGG